MKNKLQNIAKAVYYSFPIQLLVLHFKKNQILLVLWFLLFSIVMGFFGKSMGIPYLFLDPEYLDKVNFASFFIMGIALAGFSISFIITTYIIDAQRFNFLAWLPKPFSRFSLNNSLIPLLFLGVYSWETVAFQKMNGQSTAEIWGDLAGFYCGYILMTLVLFSYFRLTNKDIFKYVVCQVDEKIRQNVKATRATSMQKLKTARKRQVRVETYVDLKKGFTRTPDYRGFYDRATILQVFDQNHFNLVSVQMVIFVVLLGLGILSESPAFQLPAAASAVLFLTILMMFIGAFSYWFRGWSISLTVVLILLLNILVKTNVITKSFRAFGLDYERNPVTYDLASIQSSRSDQKYKEDYAKTIEVLEQWKADFPEAEKPKMVFVSASGGGQRAMLWTLNALQTADKEVGGDLMEHTALITGASGGLIGASYYRELVLREKLDPLVKASNANYLWQSSRDNLNPVIFSLFVNDIFLGFQKFDYEGFKYKKDRGYAFEQQLNRNTNGFLNRKLSEYREFEENSTIPMLIMGPTVINDGRKLYISPLDISYMNSSTNDLTNRPKGIEFREFFKDHGADHLRFLSGLRMSATFPYVTPNVTLPSTPAMEIMDAGMTDNYGVSDAVRFIMVFSEWIEKNTSGIVFLVVRDSQKNAPVAPKENLSLFQKMFSPIEGFYKNFESIQDLNNDTRLEQLSQWFEGDIDIVSLEYNSANNPMLKERASLNWRLTEREKLSIIENIDSKRNIGQLEKLKKLLSH